MYHGNITTGKTAVIIDSPANSRAHSRRIITLRNFACPALPCLALSWNRPASRCPHATSPNNS